MDKYKYKGSPGIERERIGRADIYVFIDWKASWHEESHSMVLDLFTPFKALKKEILLSAILEMNLSKEVEHPFRDWICLGVEGGSISMIA